MSRKLKFKETLISLGNDLTKVNYNNGDIGDIGNEVGFKLGSILKNLNDDEINDFIHGFKHGVSLTNGTH
jgi:hypothetical protein